MNVVFKNVLEEAANLYWLNKMKNERIGVAAVGPGEEHSEKSYAGSAPGEKKLARSRGGLANSAFIHIGSQPQVSVVLLFQRRRENKAISQRICFARKLTASSAIGMEHRVASILFFEFKEPPEGIPSSRSGRARERRARTS